MKVPNQYVWWILKNECHYDVVFELFCLLMCLMALDNINLKKISQELFDKYNYKYKQHLIT